MLTGPHSGARPKQDIPKAWYPSGRGRALDLRRIRNAQGGLQTKRCAFKGIPLSYWSRLPSLQLRESAVFAGSPVASSSPSERPWDFSTSIRRCHPNDQGESDNIETSYRFREFRCCPSQLLNGRLTR